MRDRKFNIRLGHVDVAGLETEEDFGREADRLVPKALEQIGEEAARFAWDELQKALRGKPGATNGSMNDKRKFIREAAQKHRRNASSSERREVKRHIVQELKEMKEKSD